MKNERLLQSIAEFLQGKAYLFFITYDDHLWDIYMSVGDGDNGAIIILFDPGPAPFAVGNRRIDAVECRPEQKVLLEGMAPISARPDPSGSGDH